MSNTSGFVVLSIYFIPYFCRKCIFTRRWNNTQPEIGRKGHGSGALAMELRLLCFEPSICHSYVYDIWLFRKSVFPRYKCKSILPGYLYIPSMIQLHVVFAFFLTLVGQWLSSVNVICFIVLDIERILSCLIFSSILIPNVSYVKLNHNKPFRVRN